MKWYSVKKYIPTCHSACHLLRLSNGKFFSLELGEFDGKQWFRWCDTDLIEFDDYKVTHFCIPDPVEIEE